MLAVCCSIFTAVMALQSRHANISYYILPPKAIPRLRSFILKFIPYASYLTPTPAVATLLVNRCYTFSKQVYELHPSKLEFRGLPLRMSTLYLLQGFGVDFKTSSLTAIPCPKQCRYKY